MKNLSKLLVLFLVLATSCSQDEIERKISFDYDWSFQLDGKGEWRSVDLPHDWSIEGSVAETNKMGDPGGYFPDGVGLYRKDFEIGKEYKDKKVSLYFEGSYMQTTVLVNGQEVGTHDYGYTSFAFDITPYIKLGAQNTIEVKVDNSMQQNCRWYSGSGIFRHVWLISTDQVHLKHWSNYITTPRVKENMATVAIQTTVQNESAKAKTVLVRADLTDGSYVEKVVSLEANAEENVALEVDVFEPRLWSVETPELYSAKISVKEGDKVLDEQTEYFGIRTIEYTVENGFRLNGKSMKVFGGCIHHDNGILGAAAFDRAEERKVEMMKAAGFNAVRTSHNPVSEAFLDACDRLGLMVIDESFDGWYAEKTPNDYHKLIDTHWQDDIAAMVLRDRNHPSIICWSIGNEVIERDEPQAVETAAKLSGLCRQLDPTRPVTEALACWNDKWVGQDALAAQHEVIGYNYLLDRAEADHQRVPERIIWQTESYPRDIYQNWKLVMNHDYIIGDFVWTAIDYLGESSIGRWFYQGDTPGEHYQGTHFPWHGAYCGDIDLTGWRKPVSYYRQVMFAPETAENIHMAVREPDGYFGQIRETQWSVWPTWDSWNWESWEGKPIDVEVYTAQYMKVRLYLNDTVIGEKEIGDDCLATFSVPYAAGKLRAVGLWEGEEQESVTLTTAGNPAALRISADRTELDGNGQDLSFITVEVVDKDGNVCPNAELPISCSVEGDARIAAIGNANLQDTDTYADSTHNTWKGRALVVVRAPKQNGTSTVYVSAEDIDVATLDIIAF